MGQCVRPVMNGILQGKGLVEVAEDKVYVTNVQPGRTEEVRAGNVARA
ncbi:MAG TPA: hypothetical protein VK425_12285 [Acidimicrobiales bacterium]|nr:hypothetical protein [Acidimicrobiales bacterium]